MLFNLIDAVTSLDFDPEGKLMASIDREGVLLISSVDTNIYKTHLKAAGQKGNSFRAQAIS